MIFQILKEKINLSQWKKNEKNYWNFSRIFFNIFIFFWYQIEDLLLWHFYWFCEFIWLTFLDFSWRLFVTCFLQFSWRFDEKFEEWNFNRFWILEGKFVENVECDTENLKTNLRYVIFGGPLSFSFRPQTKAKRKFGNFVEISNFVLRHRHRKIYGVTRSDFNSGNVTLSLRSIP